MRQVMLKTGSRARRSRRRKSRKRRRVLWSLMKTTMKRFPGKRRRRLRKISQLLIRVVATNCNDRQDINYQ